MYEIDSISREMPWFKRGVSYENKELGLPNKFHAMKRFFLY